MGFPSNGWCMAGHDTDTHIARSGFSVYTYVQIRIQIYICTGTTAPACSSCASIMDAVPPPPCTECRYATCPHSPLDTAMLGDTCPHRRPMWDVGHFVQLRQRLGPWMYAPTVNKAYSGGRACATMSIVISFANKIKSVRTFEAGSARSSKLAPEFLAALEGHA